MFVTMVVVLCHLAACTERVITSTDMDPEFTFFSCMGWAGQARLAQWSASNEPLLRDRDTKVDRYRCAPGHYVPRMPA